VALYSSTLSRPATTPSFRGLPLGLQSATTSTSGKHQSTFRRPRSGVSGYFDALSPCRAPRTPDGSGRGSAPTNEERQNDMARLSLPADPYIERNAAPVSTIGEPEALGKETRLVQTGPVRDRHAPLAWRPWVLLHHVRPRATGDRHGYRGSRIDNWRELVPGELCNSPRVGWIHRRPQARLWKIPSAESDVIWPDGGQSAAGELRRFLITGEDLGMRRSADNGG
jgi:hypothetical protein